MSQTSLIHSRSLFLAALGLAAVVPTSSHAQAPPLGTTANYAVLSSAGITNIGNTIITGTAALPGDIGSATSTITAGYCGPAPTSRERSGAGSCRGCDGPAPEAP